MARQRARSHYFKSVAAVVLIGIGLIILITKLDDSEGMFMGNLLCVTVREALDLLPFLVPAAWQALQTCVFEYQTFVPCHLHMLVSFLPLLHVLVEAA